MRRVLDDLNSAKNADKDQAKVLLEYIFSIRYDFNACSVIRKVKHESTITLKGNNIPLKTDLNASKSVDELGNMADYENLTPMIDYEHGDETELQRTLGKLSSFVKYLFNRFNQI